MKSPVSRVGNHQVYDRAVIEAVKKLTDTTKNVG